MKILVADFYRVNREHLMYNMTMLSILSDLQGVTEVEYIAHKGQIDFIRMENKFEERPNINFTIAHVHPYVGGKQWIKKIYYEIKNSFKLLSSSPKDDLIFFCSLSPITSLFFKTFKKFYPTKKVVITLHGDVDFIQQNKTRLRNILGKFFLWSFNVKDKNTKYLVLSKGIRQNLIDENFLYDDEVFAINHPYVFDTKTRPAKVHMDPIKIGHIGVASLEKNTQLIFELAEKFKEEIIENKIIFTIVGMSTNIDEYKNDLVRYSGNTEMLDKAEFNKQIGELDYVIFFYSDENYKFCSSGAILDAINHMIPIVSIKNQGFKYIFDEAEGRIGFLANDLDEMGKKIREEILNAYDHERYLSMTANLAAYQNKYTIAYVSKQLLEQIKTFLYA